MTKYVGLVLTGLLVAASSMPNAGQAPPSRRARRSTRARGSSSATAARRSRTRRSSCRTARSRQVGRRGQVKVPASAARVNLTGKTIIPAIIDTHTHLAHDARRARRSAAAPGVLRDRRHAQPGHGRRRCAVPGPRRDDSERGALPDGGARHHDARAGPNRQSRTGSRPKPKRGRRCRSSPIAKVDIVKIWVDDRDGTYKKLTPELYGAIIDEAHKHKLRVTAHIFALEDAKGLLRAGIDGFAHGVRDKDIDDEFVAMFKQRPNVFLIPNLPDRGIAGSLAWLSDTVAARRAQENAGRRGGRASPACPKRSRFRRATSRS